MIFINIYQNQILLIKSDLSELRLNEIGSITILSKELSKESSQMKLANVFELCHHL